MDAPDRLRAFIAKHNLFKPGTTVLAAVSGGKDSVMMCRLLHALGHPLAIAHCNFKLRGHEADEDEDFVRSLAAELDAAFYSKAFGTGQYAADKGISIQMAARELRHAWFKELLDGHGYTCLAIAHNATDNAETVLLNMLRGTGLRGAAGLPPKRGRLTRPLLCFTEDEVLAWLAVNKVAWRKDGSNASDYYKRNYLRHHVLPAMRKANPQVEGVMLRNSEKMQLQDMLLQQYMEGISAKALNTLAHGVTVNRRIIEGFNYNSALLEELLRPFGFTFKLCADISEALRGGAAAGTMFCNSRYTLLVGREVLEVFVRAECEGVLNTTVPKGCHGIALPDGGTIDIAYGSANAGEVAGAALKDPWACYADAARLQWPLLVRYAQRGDRMQPYGMAGTKLLSDLLNEYKVRGKKKQHTPVVVNGSGEIIWVPGMRTAEGIKLTAGTAEMVIFKYIINRT